MLESGMQKNVLKTVGLYSVLDHQIDLQLYERQALSEKLTNFKK